MKACCIKECCEPQGGNMIPAWLAIAFLRGDPHTVHDVVVSGATRGPYVHTEIMLGRGSDIRAYTAFEGVSGFTPCTPSVLSRTHESGQEWSILKYNLAPGGYEKAYALILELLATNLPYNRRDLWQCCIKVCLPFEQDLDCETPQTWKPHGVFCSQVALLFLRRMTRNGVLSLSHGCTAGIESTNSRGCSPNTLFRVLTKK